MTDEQLPPPPPEMKAFVELLGSRDAALKLIEARGGRLLYIPHRAERSDLVEIIGADALARLATRAGGDRLKVPLGREWRVQILRARGQSHGEIASTLGMTESGVYRSLRRSGLAGNVGDALQTPSSSPHQLDLFE